MANETPGHEYRMITDNPDDNTGDNTGCAWFISGCIFILSAPFAILTIVAFIFKWHVMKWFFLFVTTSLFLWAFIERFSFSKLHRKPDNIMNRPSPRLMEAQRAKDFLGFDFGNEFTLRTTRSHDYVEILLDFSSEAFSTLQNFCSRLDPSKNRYDSEKEITITEILDYIVAKDESIIGREKITKPGITKIESYYDPQLSNGGCLWIKSQLRLEVDYGERTLKMSCTWW